MVVAWDLYIHLYIYKYLGTLDEEMDIWVEVDKGQKKENER